MLSNFFLKPRYLPMTQAAHNSGSQIKNGRRRSVFCYSLPKSHAMLKIVVIFSTHFHVTTVTSITDEDETE
ncbi:unnamed protein product [Hermetia illucens]|uniref:Uncharacterized protein n=1 Tax=Hermetia illucens TaxID=343691 RepID=A0A7R8UIB7_HERIL|nr:unnamed protein product [Hermetia illucens]